MDRKTESDKTGIGRHHVTAGLAGAKGLIAVKGLEMGDEILLDIEQFKMCLVKGVIALFAEPK